MPQDHAMRGFLIHLGIFVVVVGLLAALNLYRRPDHIWFIWVLAGWGIGLAAHDLALLLTAHRAERSDLHRQRGCAASSSICSSMSR